MKQLLAFIFALPILSMSISCGNKKRNVDDTVFQRLMVNPDSVLQVLSELDINNLSEREAARYALAHAWATDKSGMNVDNDSLLRIAYDYYNERSSDALYPRCMYYMGKYYSLVDSSEMAIQCFEKSVYGAKLQKDTITECMALEKLSKLLWYYDIKKAVKVAHEATEKYSALANCDTVNLGWIVLNECQSMRHNGDYDNAMRLCRKAFAIAKESNDSLLLCSVCTAMSYIHSETDQHDSAYFYAKQAVEYDSFHDFNTTMNLSYEYIHIDSLKEAERVLMSVTDSVPIRLYTKYYNLLRISIMLGEKDRALALLDSTTSYIDGMYVRELGAKNGYYREMTDKEQERAEQKELSEMKTKFIIAIVAFFLAAISFILYIFYNIRKNMQHRAKLNKEKMELQHEYERKLHEQEIANKDSQLSIMRSYLLKKIEVVSKIKNLKGNSVISLADADWQEVRVFLDSVDNLFVSRLTEKYPSLSEKDIRLFMLLRLQVSSKTLADIYEISEKSIKQKLYLYKSKVGLETTGNSLRSFIESF